MIIRIFRCWDVPDILRQLPGYNKENPEASGFWGDIQFICEEDGECDVAIVLNRVGRKNRYVFCAQENVWAIFQEPFIFHAHDWMIDNHRQFGKVFTPHIFNAKAKYIASYPMLAWYVDKTYDELKALDMPEKTREIAWITSNKALFPGHKERLEFLSYIQQSGLDIDIYGKGIRPIDDKWDGMAPCKYSLVIENHVGPDHWTEKLTDSYLTWSLPIYHGCPNINNYFPGDAFIRIDITKPEEALNIIKDAIANNEWEKRLDAIKISREMVLDQYNFFPYIANLAKESTDTASEKRNLILKPYKRTLVRRLLNILQRMKGVRGF